LRRAARSRIGAKVSIIASASRNGETFHVTVDSYYNMVDVTRSITQDYGFPFVYYDIPRFIEEMNRRATPDDPVYPLLDFFNRSQVKLAAMQHKRYSNDGYRQARAASGGRPDPILTDTVSYLMRHMIEEGLVARDGVDGVARAQ